jgi:acetolactate synthase-1/2/3 large subunit
MQALITAVEAKLPIKVVIFDNGSLGMVRQWQELFYQKRFFSVALSNPDFTKLAEAMGAAAFRAGTPGELDAAYDSMLTVTDRPAVVHVVVDPAENCYPMWPAGIGIEGMIPECPRKKGEGASR